MTEFLKYRFQRPELLALALTHRSADASNNERLEFLGDALIGAVIAEFLYARFPHADEGQLTRIRATLVNKASLATLARQLSLGSRLRLGEGELKSGGWRRDSILANAFEALVGAIYLDGGLDECRREILAVYGVRLEQIDPALAVKDSKTELQEYLQSRRLPLPIYLMIAIDGPPHDQTFTISCDVSGLAEPAQATARSRRQAEQEAARLALHGLLGADDGRRTS
ncbi:MAG: ribonuclease III [Gammaproteobacteria bacterium]|nr:ribonuclease III [Gammaproteobacteria bacterium]